jgi:hypothetical protein
VENPILEQAKQIARQSRNVPGDQREDYLIKAEDILLDYLKEHSQDTDAWLLLLRVECNSPLDDAERIIEYSNNILSYDPSNAYALLFLSYADYFLRGNSDDELYSKLSLAHDNNPIIMSMIEVANARYFKHRNIKKLEAALKKSIGLCSFHRTNFCMLGELYLKQGNFEEGKYLIRHGLDNIKILITAENVHEYEYDPVSIDGFFSEFFAGTTISFVEYGQLMLLIDNDRGNFSVEN